MLMLNDKRKLFPELLLAFTAPVVILVFVFIFLQIYPFGDRNIINNDLYLQYLPIMQEFQRVLHGDGSLLYSFNGGLGMNFYALSTYQNFSPINILFLLTFSSNQLVLCVTLMIMLKIGLISCSMYYYLSESSRVLPLALATLFSLSGYVLAYYFNVMWLDTIILLPLVVLGLKRAMAGEGNKLFVITLSLTLITGYYLGAMVCLFLFIYFFVEFFGERMTGFVKTFAHIGVLTLFAVMISMFVLLPTFFALAKTESYAELGEGFRQFFYYSIPSHMAQLLPGSNVTTGYGPPNIYSGLISLILLSLFIFNNAIDKRRRALKAGFVMFMFLSTNVVPLDLVWNFLHEPVALPARYSFLLTFLLIEIAAESAGGISNLSTKRTGIALSCVAALCIIAFVEGLSDIPSKAFILFASVALLILYSLVLLFMKPGNGMATNSYLSLVLLFEIIIVSTSSISAGGIVESDKYDYHRNEVDKLISIAKDRDPHARLEIIGTDNYNAPFVYDYKGASIYASSVPAANFKMLNTLLSDKEPMRNVFHFNRVGVVPNAMMNIDYYISLDKRLPNSWLKKIAEVEGCYLYESRYHTSIGYMLPEKAAGMDFDRTRPEIVGELIYMTTGEKNVVSEHSIDLERWEKIYPIIFKELFVIEKMEGRSLAGTIGTKDGGIFMTGIPYDESWLVKVDSKTIENTNSIQYFISFPLSPGQHSVEMQYMPEGLIAGVIVSLLALVAYVLYELRLRRIVLGKL